MVNETIWCAQSPRWNEVYSYAVNYYQGNTSEQYKANAIPVHSDMARCVAWKVEGAEKAGDTVTDDMLPEFCYNVWLDFNDD